MWPKENTLVHVHLPISDLQPVPDAIVLSETIPDGSASKTIPDQKINIKTGSKKSTLLISVKFIGKNAK